MTASAASADARRERGMMPAAASDPTSNEADAKVTPWRFVAYPQVCNVTAQHQRLRQIFSAALLILLSVACLEAAENSLALRIETLNRLKGMDLEANPAVRSAVLKVLEDAKGRPEFVELIRDFRLRGQETGLIDFAAKHPGESLGVEAIRLVLEAGETNALQTALAGPSAAVLALALGQTGNVRAIPLLLDFLTRTHTAPESAKACVRGLALSQPGAAALIVLVREEKLPSSCRLAASIELSQVRWPSIKEEAAKLLPPPRATGDSSLPPIHELVKLAGNAARGAEVFRSETALCSTCHQVRGAGVDFGPNLSEIGDKLGKDALYESILDPSAGVSFGFEAWQVDLKNGDEHFGILASETADELLVKAQTGIVARLRKIDVAKRVQQKLSIMPFGLQQTMSKDDLVNLIDYLASLRKAATAN